jgi:hypothetical protein
LVWNNETTNGSTPKTPTVTNGYTFLGFDATNNSGTSWSQLGAVELRPTPSVDLEVSSSATPEPGSAALIGLGGLGLFRLRKSSVVDRIRGARAFRG